MINIYEFEVVFSYRDEVQPDFYEDWYVIAESKKEAKDFALKVLARERKKFPAYDIHLWEHARFGGDVVWPTEMDAVPALAADPLKIRQERLNRFFLFPRPVIQAGTRLAAVMLSCGSPSAERRCFMDRWSPTVWSADGDPAFSVVNTDREIFESPEEARKYGLEVFGEYFAGVTQVEWAEDDRPF